ncbi:hypothetical protein TKK_0014139 [Trichogramma kaykai]
MRARDIPLVVLYASLTATGAILALAEYTSIIRTTGGPLRGEILRTARKSQEYASFKGIPYAEPPLGHLRFKPPVEKRSWTDVLLAVNESDVCLQISMWNFSTFGSENCLYMSVFTPHTLFGDNVNHSKAVMVYIYGGAYQTGYANTEQYGPDYLMENDVIMVSFNYRLGALGFLNLNHENATGNAALKDQNLVLRWVKKNIAAFGGNPNRVTLFGHSSGAVSVDLHVLSEMSAGLFSRSISMSGSPFCFYWGFESNAEAEFQALILVKSLGIVTRNKSRMLERLYDVPAKEILKNMLALNYLGYRPTVERTKPATGERFLKRCPLDYYLSGKYNRMPHIMGLTSLEMISYPRGIIFFLLKNLLKNTLNITFGIESNIFKDIEKLSKERVSERPRKIFNELLTITSEYIYDIGIDTKQRLMAKKNGYPIYYYKFIQSSGIFQRGNNIFNLTGVGHAEDLPFLFHIPVAELAFNDSNTNVMIDRFTRLITNFAKYDNPTPPSAEQTDIPWPDSGPQGKHMVLSPNPKIVAARPLSKRAAALEKLLRARYGTAFLNGCKT